MRTLPAGLKQHLSGGATTMCWCWKLTTMDGAVSGFSDHDEDVEFDGVTFEAASGFTGTQIETALGLAVGNLEAEGALSSARLNDKDLLAGRFDNAMVEIWMVNWADPGQRVLLRKGNLGEVTRGQTGFRAEIRGLAHQLNQPQGRLYQKLCDTDLGSARCGVDINDPALRQDGTVSAAETAQRLAVTGLDGFAAGWFSHGRLKWTAGANQGRVSEVRSHVVQAGSVFLNLWQEMPDAVLPGDEFTVTAGCDKRFETCKDRFSNAVNFQGFPHMPGNDFIAFYPNSDDANNDGSPVV